MIPLADVERRVLFLDALRAFKGSVSRAAKALEVSKVFYAKLKRRGVDPKRHSDPGRDVH